MDRQSDSQNPGKRKCDEDRPNANRRSVNSDGSESFKFSKAFQCIYGPTITVSYDEIASAKGCHLTFSSPSMKDVAVFFQRDESVMYAIAPATKTESSVINIMKTVFHKIYDDKCPALEGAVVRQPPQQVASITIIPFNGACMDLKHAFSQLCSSNNVTILKITVSTEDNSLRVYYERTEHEGGEKDVDD